MTFWSLGTGIALTTLFPNFWDGNGNEGNIPKFWGQEQARKMSLHIVGKYFGREGMAEYPDEVWFGMDRI